MAWIQRGTSIPGTPGLTSQFGTSVALSTDGTALIAGGPDTTNGEAKVFIWNGTSWIQRGPTFTASSGLIPSTGEDVTISGDGTTVAFGRTRVSVIDAVQVYVWDGLAWQPKGNLLTYTPDYGYGLAVSLDITGNTLAVGIPNDPNLGTNGGSVIVADYDSGTNMWIDRLQLFGGTQPRFYGSEVVLSSDGLTIAISAEGNSVDPPGVGIPGSVTVLTWDGTVWNLKGITINGFHGGDRFGKSLDMSADGNTLIIGGETYDSSQNPPSTPSDNSGIVRVYDFIGGVWTERGGGNTSTFIGSIGSFQGTSVSISDDGLTIAYGTPMTGSAFSASVTILRWNGGSWSLIATLPQISPNQEFGYAVGLSGNANSVSVGIPEITADGDGSVRVFTPPLAMLAPIPGNSFPSRNVGDTLTPPLPPVSAFSGTFSFSGGTGTVRVGIGSVPAVGLVFVASVGTYGSLSITNTLTGEYTYLLTSYPTMSGTITDNFTIVVGTEGGVADDSKTYTVTFNMNPNLIRQALSTVQINKITNGAFTFVGSNFTSTPASGGTGVYTYSTLNAIGSGGMITVMNEVTTYVPNMNPDTFPNTIGSYQDNYNLRVTDTTTDREDTVFRVLIEVLQGVVFSPTTALDVIIIRNVNGTVLYTSIPLGGTLATMGNTPIFGIQGGTVGLTETTLTQTYGTGTVNNTTGLYSYTIDTFPNTVGNPAATDTFVFTVSTLGLLSNSTATYNVIWVVNPELLRVNSSVSVIKIMGGSFGFIGSDTTTVQATGGTASLPTDYTYGIISTIGAYGTVTINNASTTFNPLPNSFPIVPGSYTDVYTLNVQDVIGQVKTSSFTANITVAPSSTLDSIPDGLVKSNVGGGTKTNGLTGTLSTVGGDPPITFGIVGGTSSGGVSTRVGLYGTLSVNQTSGVYTYLNNNPLTTVGMMTDSFTVEVLSMGVQADTTTYNIVNILNPALVFNTPTTGTVMRSVNDTLPPMAASLSGTLTASNGSPPYSFSIDGVTTSPAPNQLDQMMMFGTISLNTVTGAYTYTIVTPPNVQGTFNDDATFRLTDDITDNRTVTFRVTYTVIPELRVTMPGNGSVIKQTGNPNLTLIDLNGIISSSGGRNPRSYAIIGSSFGTYGILTLNATTGAYSYNPLAIPDTVTSDTDVFTIQVRDPDGRVVTTTFTVNITVTQGIFLIPPSAGTFIKSVNGTNTVTSGLSGTLIQMGGGPPLRYGILVGSSIVTSAFGSNGILNIDQNTGAYNYNPLNIPNEETEFSDRFTFILEDGIGARATTSYQVNFFINPQLLIDQPTPSAGSITRNIADTGFKATGLSGTYAPRGGLPSYIFTIQGGMDTGTFFESTDTLGKLRVNKSTGFYEFIDPNIPNTPGIYSNTFTIVVTDMNGDTQTLSYVVRITIENISLDLLPVFTDVQNQSTIRYWNFIVHTGISSQLTRFFENTEILVVGQTDSNPVPERNVDNILRQLLLAAIETSDIGKGGEDVVTNIRNNTKDVLETEERSGALTYSFRFTRKLTTDQEVERVIELADILSTSHKNFLLNRYRSNIGEGLVIFYYDDAPQTVIDQILTQVIILSRIGVAGVILVLIATDTSRNPAIDQSYASSLGEKQSALIRRLREVTTITTLLSCSIRYDIATNRYQNLGVKTSVASGESRVPEQLYYAIPTNPSIPTQTLFDAISSLPQFLRDTAFPRQDLRIIITEVDQTMDQAKGVVLYSRLNPSSTSDTFISSRPLPPTQTTSRTLRANLIFLEVAENQPQQVILSQITGSSARPRDLRPGDVLYDSAYAFSQPSQITLLISTVSGVDIQNAVGKPIYLQIDDGVRFPNNPVFTGIITSIDQSYDSSTLQPLGSTNSILFGLDYQIKVQLSTAPGQLDTLSAAPLELYNKFPRLGFVTVYFGRKRDTTTGIGPYARGSVIELTR